MIYGNSLSFNASSLSCLIINSEKRVWKTDNPTHSASADHNHINFGIRLPFTLHYIPCKYSGARGLCHPLHNSVGTEQWHPILPSRGAQYHGERDFWSLVYLPCQVLSFLLHIYTTYYHLTKPEIVCVLQKPKGNIGRALCNTGQTRLN